MRALARGLSWNEQSIRIEFTLSGIVVLGLSGSDNHARRWDSSAVASHLRVVFGRVLWRSKGG